MAIKRTTEIFIEATRRFVVCQSESSEQVACQVCGSPMLAAERLAVLSGVSRRAVYQSIETGKTHFVETETGAVLICPPSFAASLRGDETNQ